MLTNGNYLVLMASNSFIFCAIALIFSFISWITKAYSLPTHSNGIIFLVGNLVGCLGVLASSAIGKQSSYKMKCIVLGIGYLCALLLLLLGFETSS